MDLNNDIVIEILLLLPLKSLLRFRIVCKSWRNIIESSPFTYFHLQNRLREDDDDTLFLQFSTLPTRLSILDANNGRSHKGFFPAFEKFINDNCGSGKVTTTLSVARPVYGSIFIAGPVNGLICMYNKNTYILSSTLSIAVYNPYLDKIKILPLSPVCSSLGLMYGKENCNREIGFGFDPITKDYKTVQLIMFPKTGDTCVEVYSGKTNTWRELATGSSLSFICRIDGIKSKTKSGSSAYWRVQRKTGDCILSFNMKTEVFETVSYPPNFDVRVRSCVVFAKVDDSLTLFVRAFDYCNRLEVWELERSREWVHVRDVNVFPIMHRLNLLSSPISLWKGDGGLVLMEIGRTERNLIFYDNSTKRVRFCCEIHNADSEMVHFTGSLISP